MRDSTVLITTLIALGIGAFVVTNYTSLITNKAEGCGCNKKVRKSEEKFDAHQGQSYPEVFDPVFDYLPRYRFPEGTAWSKEYNPAHSYRPLDYQVVTFDSATRAGGVV